MDVLLHITLVRTHTRSLNRKVAAVFRSGFTVFHAHAYSVLPPSEFTGFSQVACVHVRFTFRRQATILIKKQDKIVKQAYEGYLFNCRVCFSIFSTTLTAHNL